jgi:type I restriction enzyme S subunit
MDNEPIAPRWRTVRFGDVVKLNTDRCADPRAAGIERYVGLEHIEPEDLRIRRWGSVADGTTFTNLFRPGHVLFGKRRAYQRKVAVADFEGVCSSDIYVFESRDPDVLLPELLPFLCQTERFYEHAVGTSAGSLSPRTHWAQLAQYEFALPPLEEQRRLAEVLSTQEVLGTELETALSAIKGIKRSRLAEVFGVYAPPKRGWHKLDQYCSKVGDGTHIPPGFISSGVPFLLVSNIGSGSLDPRITKWISTKSYLELTRSFRPSRGDVLYSLVGSYGIPVYVDWDWDFSFQRHIGVIRTCDELLRGKYLFYFLQSLPALWQANQSAEGLAQKTITLGSLRSFLVPIPSLDVQNRITSEFEVLDKSVAAIESRANSVKQLKTSFLGELFF